MKEALLTDDQRAELRKHIADDDANPSEGFSWPEVRDEALASLDAEFLAELDREGEAHESDPTTSLTLEEFEAQIQATLDQCRAK